MTLAILQVAFPFAPVGPDAAGGAEQILTRIDEALCRAGHRSMVIACAGSRVEGVHLEVPRVTGLIDDAARRLVHEKVRAAIAEALGRWPVDVLHFHGVDCHAYLPETRTPMLVTLHCPASFYDLALFERRAGNLHFHCVSASQSRKAPPGLNYLPVIPNGVPSSLAKARHARRRFAFALGRICPEKNFHEAIDAAKLARTSLLLAGETFPYAAHEAYFREQILPRLDAQRRYIGTAGFARKRRLLASARCLLLPSLAEETSSLVAMEALACGTPVIAYPSGALPELILDGETGFLVRNPREMAQAIEAVGAINPEVCRAAVCERFSSERMAEAYFSTYRQLACSRSGLTYG